MSIKIKNPKSQIPNPKQIPNPNFQNSKLKFWSLEIWSLVIVCNLVLGIWNFNYAAPAYGTKLPEKNKIFLGIQTHSIFKRYLIAEEGKLRSWQNFLLLSYGVFDWLSLDLKGGAGYIKAHPVGGDELDYSSSFAGGYGFRLKFYETKSIKTVFGFQHISVHPRAINVGSTKHKAVLDDWQFSLLGSGDFKKIVPYLGLRWSRIDYIHWQDESRKRIKSDRTKDAGLIAGFDLPITKNLWLNLEGNFLDSEALAASLNYSF